MKHFVYILHSESTDSYYKGQTSDLDERLLRHNSGYEKATKHGIPWKIILVIEKSSRSEAMILERKLKNMSRKKLQEFIRKQSDQNLGSKT